MREKKRGEERRSEAKRSEAKNSAEPSRALRSPQVQEVWALSLGPLWQSVAGNALHVTHITQNLPIGSQEIRPWRSFPPPHPTPAQKSNVVRK